jgi:hypothetical protein
LELTWKDGRIIGNVCMLFVALPSNVRPCVCAGAAVSEAGNEEQWSEEDAVTRGEVVSARVLHSPTKEHVPNSSAEPQTTSTLKASAQTSPSQSTRPGEQGGRSPIRY